MFPFPKKLEFFLLQYIKDQFYSGTKREIHREKPFNAADLKFFAPGVTKLSAQFTSSRSQLKGDYLSRPEFRSAYLLYFLPINFTKAAYVFRQLPASFFKRKSLRILDLGCGPATASLAFLNECAGRKPGASIRIDLVDQNRNILTDGKNLLDFWYLALRSLGPLRIQAQRTSVTAFRNSQRYDLIILHHVLNEMTQWKAHQRAQWLKHLLENNLKKDGVLALVEPALKRPGRELMALRDHLLETCRLEVLAPCLHEKPCPMLAGTRQDWCHFYVDWPEPSFLKQLDRLVGNDNRFLKLSYLLMSPLKAFATIQDRRPYRYRVVSNRMATRGKTEVVLCGEPGRIRLTLLDRDQSPTNRILKKIRRGDLLEWKQWEESQYAVNGHYRLKPGSICKKSSY